jgi:hypothetical protein
MAKEGDRVGWGYREEKGRRDGRRKERKGKKLPNYT